jgi:hypothetical protein
MNAPETTAAAGRETTARAAAQNRGWERRGERIRRQALARDSDPALLALCNEDRALYDDLVFGGMDWAAAARARAEERAARRALLPRFRRLLEGTEAEVWVSEDGPHADAAGREYDGFFVVVGCDAEVWPEVERRLRAAGFSWLNVADETPPPGEELVCDVVDAWRGACVWGCGRVYADVEGHAARCERRAA